MRDVIVEEVRASIEQGDVTVIDVLAPKSYREQHLPGALNIPVSEARFEEHLREAVPDKHAPVVFYCSGPDCNASPEASERAEAAGYTDVREFRGGLDAWAQAGYAFEKGLVRPAGPAR